MSMKLRELIREVRQCKSASAERAVIAKELANIRTAIKDKNQLEYRHRNVAKLMYCDMLGYPTHFGQMEVLKLLASKPFVEKRLGYLALMQLLDENTEVLMLATQSLKQDMCHENPFVVGLALCAMGNIASTDISRDLGRELEKLLKHSNPYIRKKALCTAIRVIQRVPEMSEEYFKSALITLEDSGQGHGPMVAAAQLLYAICSKRGKLCRKLKKYSTHIISRLSSLLRSSYDPDHDIGGVTDPFLQVYLLKLLRLVSVGDKKLSDDVDSTLAQIATNTESNKNPGNSILYECVRTIMSIEKQSSLHVLAINILGRFLVNRDNNVRYVALNALCNAVTSNTDAIQRHRNTIVECLKDADLTIRKRSLDLIYALVNKKNIRSLARDLLNFLTISNTTTSSVDTSSEPSPSKEDDSKLSKKDKKRSKKEKKKEKEKEIVLTPKSEDGKPVFINASSLSQPELEFRQELASKICMVVERYAPNRKWHIDTIIQVMTTTTSTGFNREQEVISNLFILVSNSVSLQAYCTYKLYECISKLQINSDPIRQFTAWLIGEYGDKLMDDSECQDANDELMKDKQANDDDEFNNKAVGSPHYEIEQMIMDIGPFQTKTADEIISMLKYIVKHEKSTETTKGYALTALMKIRHKYEAINIDKDDKIDAILEQFQDDKQIEVQQRSIEFLSLFENTDQDARTKILKAMPVPKIERMFEQSKSNLLDSKFDDEDDDEDEEESEEEADEEEEEEEEESEEEKSDEEESEEEEEDSDEESESDDRRKKKGKHKKDKKRKEKEKEKEKEKDKKSARKKKKDKPVVPMLSGPDDFGANGSEKKQVSAPSNVNNNVNHVNGGNDSKAAGVDLLNFGGMGAMPATSTQQPAQQAAPDLLGDILGGFDSGSSGNVAPPNVVQNVNNSIDPLGDILGSNTPSTMPSQAQPVSGNKSQPFEAYNTNGITATFNFVPAQGQGVCRVLAVFHNSNSFDVTDFSFMIAVPKYIKLQFKPANGTQLLALSQNSITQRFQLTNTLHGQKPFIIRVQVVYNANGQQIKDRAQVTFPQNCC